MSSETTDPADSDKPLGRVVLIPVKSVPIVHGKLMMKIMVTLTQVSEPYANDVGGVTSPIVKIADRR